jgi:branched-chain amino acid transport system ATP-binding protein
MTEIFRAENLTMRFGGLVAVSGFDLALRKGEIVGLIGPNGAGKTTVFNMIAGYHAPTEGKIRFEEKVLNGRKAHEITKLGIARTFQNIRLFPDLKVIENMMLAYHCRIRSSFIGAVFHFPLYRREEKEMLRKAMLLLEDVGLADSAGERSSSLPYGKQRKLEIARALGTGPKLLLLDEPAAGMNPSETQELLDLILRLREQFGLTILLIEHDMKFVMKICERIKVLDYGITIAEGTPNKIQNDPKVIEAYLGEVRSC